MTKNISEDTYDNMPYESYPYPQSSPDHLRTVATLFGMKAPALENARVLELGCAAGGNLVPFAFKYPKAEVIGVDLSKVQIEDGIKNIKNFGIKNLTLKHMSITDIDESMGKFDYIISHGVFSWIPREVEEKMLEICGKMLTDNGVAYISYNTLPGWNMVRTIRDMMIYHSSGFQSDKDKVSQARLLLEFIKDSTEGSKTPYSEFLRNEAQLLSNQSDAYLRHDHLETVNNQFYFNDFMKIAQANNLQYLGDASVASMYLGNLPQKAREKLSEITDIVRSEQYVDFITNRRFRSTILCKNNVAINRSLNVVDAEKFYASMNVQAEKPLSEIKIDDALESLKFYFNSNKDINVTTSSPIMKAIIYTFVENPNYTFSVDEIVEASAKKLKNINKDDIKREYLNNAMKLILSGYLSISSEAPKFTKTIAKKPVVSELVRKQCEHTTGMWVTNMKHERVGINAFDKVALKYLDGSNDLESIKAKIIEHINKGELTMSRNNMKIDDATEIKKEIDSVFENFLSRISNSSLIVK
jgi:methyltransferase-like protein/ubiquinone/menaquinone biosynthesis C-methylase UbiE